MDHNELSILSYQAHKLKTHLCAAVLCWSILTFGPLLYWAMFISFSHHQTQLDELGNSLAQQLANNNADRVLHKDSLSLSVILHQIINNNSITHAAIYDNTHHVLAEAGAPAPEGNSTVFKSYDANIIFQDASVGSVRLTLKNSVLSLAGI